MNAVMQAYTPYSTPRNLFETNRSGRRPAEIILY